MAFIGFSLSRASIPVLKSSRIISISKLYLLPVIIIQHPRKAEVQYIQTIANCACGSNTIMAGIEIVG